MITSNISFSLLFSQLSSISEVLMASKSDVISCEGLNPVWKITVCLFTFLGGFFCYAYILKNNFMCYKKLLLPNLLWFLLPRVWYCMSDTKQKANAKPLAEEARWHRSLLHWRTTRKGNFPNVAALYSSSYRNGKPVFADVSRNATFPCDEL